jgi:tetratricopeptide (TPR) repeat protein
MQGRIIARTLDLSFSIVFLFVGSAISVAGGDSSVPLFSGMGDFHRQVTTSSPPVQKHFDQGLVWAYAFNHDEAIRSFHKAAELDPDCPMAWWGIALCNGPHINNPSVPEEREAAAWAALRKAIVAGARATPVERALIHALSKRYANPVPGDRVELDRAYADAMAGVWGDYPKDPDVGTLYAEAMMDLRPWDLWTQDRRAQPGTQRIVAVLEEVLRLDPDHPGANHLYIHAVEPSREPERANAAAERLRDLVPASGHLVHMPSHVYVLTGRWAEAARQNELAIQADKAYRKIAPRQGFYHVYMLHNHHMLAFASMMEGRSETAIRAAREVVESVPADFMKRESALVDPYMGAVYDALKRFGRWDAILKEPAPPSFLPITTAMWRLNRSVAHAAKGEIALAEQERTAFQKAASAVSEDALMAINPASHVLKIAKHFLDGEIAYRRGDIDEAVKELRRAIALEDQLRYMEPPEWMQPVRHTLGAVLLSAGRVAEAETVYREDLADWPENGWSLYGLSRCLSLRGVTSEASKVEKRFQKIWSRADVPIGSSCKCVPKT